MTTAGSSTPSSDKTITEHELEQCKQANATGRTPVVFVHGLWLLPNSWDRWAALFEESGYVALTPGWPDDPETVEQAAEHPEVFAGKSVGQVADHFETIIRGPVEYDYAASFLAQHGITKDELIRRRGGSP